MATVNHTFVQKASIGAQAKAAFEADQGGLKAAIKAAIPKGVDGVGFQSASLDAAGNLRLTKTDGTAVDLGVIKGKDGNDGAAGVGIQSAAVNASGRLILTKTDDTTVDAGLVKGADGGATTVRLVHDGTSWPARPATGYVDWLDPTGTAPSPVMQAGDTLIRAAGATPVGPTEALTSTQQSLKDGWFSSAGSPTIDATAGTITLKAGADKAGLSDVPVAVGAELVLSATLTSGSLADLTVDVDFWTAENGYIESKWGESPLSTTVPANAHHASVILQGSDGNTLVVDTVSLTQAV